MSRIMKCKRGMGTVEIVIIIAVLVGVALLFREAIMNFVTEIINSIFNNEDIITKLT
ncbi:MAG: Flp1 family type IVb pilin [Clostridia bacterium]